MRLVTRIFALIAATLLLVASAEFASILTLRADRFTEVRIDTIQLAKTTAISMDRVLEGARQVLATLAKLPASDGWDARACSLLAATANSDFEYDYIAAVNLDGLILCTSSGSSRPGATLAYREILERVVASGQFAVGSYGVGTVSRNELLRIGYPVLDAKGAVTGMVYAGINLTWLTSVVANWEFPPDTTLNIADRAGVIIARYPDAASVGRRLPAGLAKLLAEREPTTVETAGIDGIERLFGYTPADAGGTRGLAVFVGLNPATAFEVKIDRTIWINIAIILCGLLLSGLVAWFYVHRFLERPIDRLLRASARWRGGDWTARTGSATGIPEFDRLATSFDEMAATVAARDDAIQYRDSISRAITSCAAELVAGASLDEAIPRFLKTMGEAFHADRIPVIEVSADGRGTLRYVWHSDGAPAKLTPEFFTDLPVSVVPEMEAWRAPLRRGEVVATSAKDVHGFVKTIFDAQKIVSNLQAPIHVEGVLWGQLAIDDCRVDRLWTPGEIDALKVLADLIGASIARRRRDEKLASADEVIRNSPAILFRMSVESGSVRMTYVSDNVTLLGFSPAALTDDSNLFVTLIHPDDRATTQAGFAAVMSGGAGGTFEVRIATASGVYRWMETRYTSTRDALGRLTEVVGVLVDITDRKLAEEKLQFANTVLTTQSETSPDAISIVGNDRKIFSINRRFAEMWGISPSDVAAKDYATMSKTVTAALKNPEAADARVRHLYAHPTESGFDDLETVDGRFIERHTAPLRTPAGDNLGRVWFFRDVTDRKLAEEKLQFANTVLTTQSETSPDAIVVIGTDKQIILINRRFSEMWHIEPNDLASGNYDAMFDTVVSAIKNPEAAAARIRHFYKHPTESGYDQLETVDGRFIDRHTSPLRTPAGDHLGRIWFYRDTTQRNRAEIALKRERDFSEAVIDSLPGIFFVANSQGKIVHFNKGLAAATAAPGVDLSGRDVLTKVTEADRKLARSKIRETLERGHAEAEVGVTDDAGVVRRFLMTIGQLPLEGGPGILGVGIDVTDARLVEKQLGESEQRLRTIFASVRDGIIVRDIDTGAVLEANQSACDMFGYTHEEMLSAGSRVGGLSSNVPPYTGSVALQHFAAARAGGLPTFEWHMRAKDGHTFVVEITLRQVRFGDRKYLLSTLYDVSERMRTEAKILEMARLDSLTGLPNRTVFADAIDQAIARVRAGGKGFAVIYIDLDHFKDVNDTLGHPVGDALLKLVAQRLRAGVRATDTVARFGGDEFAVLESEIGDPADAAVLAAQLLKVLTSPYSFGSSEIRSGASIGISVYGPDAADAESLLARADVALYRAKSEGRGTYRFFTDAMDAEVRTRVSLGNDLRDAIGTPQLFLHYQPQVEAATGRIIGVEALTRWRHPTRGLVSPVDFIQAAERNGLIVALGHWVLWEACRQAGKWHKAGIAPGVMGVNLSALQFKTPLELEEDIAEALAASELPPDMLELEITESVLMNASRDNNATLVRLRASGVRLSLDDFGTGYSSLDYLRRFPMDRIKIAQNFVFALGTETGSAAVVKATIGLAHELGINVIAEGVETEHQLHLLQSWGCEEVQGYYFAKPMAPEALTPLLRAGRIVPPTTVSRQLEPPVAC